MLISIIVGAVLGFLSGLGIGGGSLLILWLTTVIHTGAETARAINLMFFLAASGSVSLLRMKRGKLQVGNILPAALSGCIAAGVCAIIAPHIEPDALKKIFGGLLLLTGMRELLYRPRKAR